MKKQLKYASDTQAAFVAFAGEQERGDGVWAIKHMARHEEARVKATELVTQLQAWTTAG